MASAPRPKDVVGVREPVRTVNMTVRQRLRVMEQDRVETTRRTRLFVRARRGNARAIAELWRIYKVRIVPPEERSAVRRFSGSAVPGTAELPNGRTPVPEVP